MELLLILGLISVLALAALGVLAFLRQRRTGTILAVSMPARTIKGLRRSATQQAGPTGSGHR